MKIIITLVTIFTHFQLHVANHDPLSFIMQNINQDQWLVYTVPAVENTRSQCCWNQNNHSFSVNGTSVTGFESCELDKQNNGFGSNDLSLLTKNINIYVKITNREIQQIMPVGDACIVHANGQKLTRLDNINQSKSLAFLKRLTNSDKDKLANNALYAISLHKSKKASIALYEIALQNNDKTSEESVFWLGQSRHDGVDYLKMLYNKLPFGSVKKQLNFALSQSKNPQATQMLLEKAKDFSNREMQQEALFWLTESSPKQAKKLILKILTTPSHQQEIDNAVFNLSRIDRQSGEDALFEILKGDYSKSVKKKALFWLTHSDNENTITRLERILMSNIIPQ